MKTRLLFSLLRPLSGLIGRQLGHPRGWFGRVVMTRALNRGNRELITSTLDCLTLSPETRLLDVGFGGGLALQLARERGVLHLFGADPSMAAVEQLQATQRKWLEGGTLILKQAGVEFLPFDAQAMHAIVSTNTVYFWADLAAAFGELRRVLAPGGTLALGFTSSQKLRAFESITQRGFCFYANEDLVTQAQSAGFASVKLVALRGRDTEGDYVLVATA
jgi:arsenite methyltransferase